MKDELSLYQAQLTYKKRLEAVLTELRSQQQPRRAQQHSAMAQRPEQRSASAGKRHHAHGAWQPEPHRAAEGKPPYHQRSR